MVDPEHWEVAMYHLVKRIPSVKLFLALPSLDKGSDKSPAEKSFESGSEKVVRILEKKSLASQGPSIEEMMVHLRQQAVL